MNLRIRKISVVPLAALVLCLAGCFVFDNPIENAVPHSPTAPPTTPPPTPTAAFQIVVTSALYGGTYVWSSADDAYKANVGGTPFYVYMDASGFWILTSDKSQTYGSVGVTHSVQAYLALPPTTATGWSPTDRITSVDDSAGGISGPGAPDTQVTVGQALHVTFLASDPANAATYQWLRSSSQGIGGQNLPATGNTYTTTSGDLNKWISVVVTPTDSTGTVTGTPFASPSVMVK
jgi:hypothetical protein